MFNVQCAMPMCNAYVQCLCAMPICNAYVQCLCAMPMCNANVQCLCAMPMCNAYVQCLCAMPMCNAYMQCLYAMTMCNARHDHRQTDRQTQAQVQLLSCAFAAKQALRRGLRSIQSVQCTNAGVLLQNFQTEVYCLRSMILASEVYFLAPYQYN